jgi:hypothetical protein
MSVKKKLGCIASRVQEGRARTNVQKKSLTQARVLLERK